MVTERSGLGPPRVALPTPRYSNDVCLQVGGLNGYLAPRTSHLILAPDGPEHVGAKNLSPLLPQRATQRRASSGGEVQNQPFCMALADEWIKTIQRSRLDECRISQGLQEGNQRIDLLIIEGPR